jgi:hypothetical protein
MNKRQKEQNRLLRNTFITIGIILAAFLVILFLNNYSKSFDYQGVKFYTDKEAIQGITLYRTSLPAVYQNKSAAYNVYLRNSPFELAKIPFDGQVDFMPNMVINTTDELNCNGDGMIAIANIVNLYEFIGTKVIRDENASCDPQGRYTYLKITPSNTTEIKETGPECYEIDVANCEILKGTERYLLESLVELNKKLAG